MVKNIEISITEQELQELMDGEEFNWCFDGINVKLFQGEESG